MAIAIEQFKAVLSGETLLEVQTGVGASPIVAVPADKLLFQADFQRDGSDLLLVNDFQPTLRIAGYFDHPQPPDLMGPSGGVLKGSAVETLAGPELPGQIAQASDASGALAIAVNLN